VLFLMLRGLTSAAQTQAQPATQHAIVVHAAHLLDVRNGRVVSPGEVLVQGDRIVEVGPRLNIRRGRR